MATLLNLPKAMKHALENNDYKEVVTLYQRAVTIPNTSSLKIVTKIKQAAEAVVMELKRLLYNSMFSNASSPAMIIQYGKIFLELEGSRSYLKVLRSMFLLVLCSFLSYIIEARNSMINDSLDAFDKGQEMNLSMSSSVMSTNTGWLGVTGTANTENENIYSIARRYMSKPQRPHHSSGGNNSTRTVRQFSSSSVNSAFNGSVDTPPRQNSRTVSKFSLVDDDMMDNGTNFLETEDSNVLELQQEWLSSESGQKSIDALLADYDMNNVSADGSGALSKDFGELLCHIVRKTFSDRLIEIILRYFNVLYKLSCEIIAHETSIAFNTSTAGGGAGVTKNSDTNSIQPFSSGKSSVNTSGMTTKTNIGANALTSTAKLLGLTLGKTNELISQTIDGIQPNFTTLLQSTDLQNAANELDMEISSLISTYPGINVPVIVSLNLSSQNVPGGARFNDLITSNCFQAPILLQHEALLDVFSLYDALESAMKSTSQAMRNLLSQQQGAKQERKLFKSLSVSQLNANNAVYSSRSTMETALAELQYDSPTSPYFDSMRILSTLSKVGESSVAQKILDKLSDRALYLSDTLLALTTKESSSNEASVVVGNESVEGAVVEFEKLVLRGIEALAVLIKR